MFFAVLAEGSEGSLLLAERQFHFSIESEKLALVVFGKRFNLSLVDLNEGFQYIGSLLLQGLSEATMLPFSNF
jgi:hypothetical protein